MNISSFFSYISFSSVAISCVYIFFKQVWCFSFLYVKKENYSLIIAPPPINFFLLYTIKKIINNFKMLPRNVISNKHFLTITSSVFVYRCVYIYCFSFAILPFCLSCIWISCNNITVVYPFVFPVFICYPQSILLLNVAFPFVNL